MKPGFVHNVQNVAAVTQTTVTRIPSTWYYFYRTIKNVCKLFVFSIQLAAFIWMHSTISMHMCHKGREGVTMRWSTHEAKLLVDEKGYGALAAMRWNTPVALLGAHHPSPLSAPWVGGQGLASPVANV